MPPNIEELLTDQQLREASPEQISALVARIDMELRRRGEPGIVLREPDDSPEPDDLEDPLDPGTIGYE